MIRRRTKCNLRKVRGEGKEAGNDMGAEGRGRREEGQGSCRGEEEQEEKGGGEERGEGRGMGGRGEGGIDNAYK